MNASVPALSTQLNDVQIAITRYFLLPIYVCGNLGNIANILLFSQKTLRSNNVCAWYFIALSVANLIGLNVGGLSRILSLLNNFTLEITSIIFCKTRNYFIQTSAVMGRYFLCLISIDRWMITSSNEQIRRWSSLKNGRYFISFGVGASMIFCVHIPIGFDIKNRRCYATLNDIYTIYFNTYNLFIICVPIIIMTLFSTLVLMNIRHSRRRLGITSMTVSNLQQANVKTSRRRDMQFIQLAFGQVLVFLTLIVSYGVHNLYDLITSSRIKSADQRVIEAFVSGLVVNLNYTSVSVRFSASFLSHCVTSIFLFR